MGKPVLAVFVLVAALASTAPTFGEGLPLMEPPTAVPSADPNPGLYQEEVKPTGPLDRLSIVLAHNVLPNAPGALLLLGLSLLFSTINFYSELPEEHRAVRRTARYLVPWVFLNYTFALILLVLMLPAAVPLTELSKTLFMYCLAATALPELSANIRLQLGRSKDRTLDLYKYKTRVSDLIRLRILRASSAEQHRDWYCLQSSYADHLQALKARLLAFVHRAATLRDSERDAMLRNVREHEAKSSVALLELVEGPTLMPQVIDFFRDDIDRFRSSPIAALMGEIQPMLSREEAEQLVALGITSRGRFLARTLFAFQRAHLAKQLGEGPERMATLHFSTRASARRRRNTQLQVAASGLVALGLIGGLLSVMTGRPYSAMFGDLASRVTIGRDPEASLAAGTMVTPVPAPMAGRRIR